MESNNSIASEHALAERGAPATLCFTRRSFVATSLGALVTYAVVPVNSCKAQSEASDSSHQQMEELKIELLEEEYYPASFVKFARKSTFSSVEQAMSSIRNPELRYRLVPIMEVKKDER